MASGGYKGLNILGVLSELSREKFYDIENIKTIYGSSIGAYVGVLLCLKMSWDDLLDYFINRPWQKAVKVPSITDFFSDKGFVDCSFFAISLKNLLLSKDLNLDITFQELYDYSNIELHMFTVEVQSFVLKDLSVKTTPSMKILEGIHQTCAIPYVFKPSWYNNNYYIDGGVLNNYPLGNCINDGANKEEILGIKFEHDKNYKVTIINKESNILEFSRHLHNKLIELCRKINVESGKEISNEIIINNFTPTDVAESIKLIKEKIHREKYINYGKKIAREFLNLIH